MSGHRRFFNSSRVSRNDLPNIRTICSVSKWCCYRSESGDCDEPRINKGNSDAACHRTTNKDLLKRLTPIITGNE